MVQVVPEIVREEFINVGVILYCRQRRFLDMRIYLDADRLRALSAAQVDLLRARLDLMACVCAGGPEAGVIRGAAALGAIPLAGFAAQHNGADLAGSRRPVR